MMMKIHTHALLTLMMLLTKMLTKGMTTKGMLLYLS